MDIFAKRGTPVLSATDDDDGGQATEAAAAAVDTLASELGMVPLRRPRAAVELEIAEAEIQMTDSAEAQHGKLAVICTMSCKEALIELVPAFERENGYAVDFSGPRADEWLRTMAYQELVGPADAYYTGGNIHNFRMYIRPEDGRALYLPWDWDSSFQASASAPITGMARGTRRDRSGIDIGGVMLR